MFYIQFSPQTFLVKTLLGYTDCILKWRLLYGGKIY